MQYQNSEMMLQPRTNGVKVNKSQLTLTISRHAHTCTHLGAWGRHVVVEGTRYIISCVSCAFDMHWEVFRGVITRLELAMPASRLIRTHTFAHNG